MAGEYILTISNIEMKKTPQSGDWRAGVTVWQDEEKDNRDSWHGGEKKFEGASAVLPVNLELGGLGVGEPISLFIGIDDDAEDAGSISTAEDKLTLTFKVFPTRDKERNFGFSSSDWSVIVHYTLQK